MIVSGCGGLPSSQQNYTPVILIVRTELEPLLAELLDVCLEDGERKRVERQYVLSVLGLAI